MVAVCSKKTLTSRLHMAAAQSAFFRVMKELRCLRRRCRNSRPPTNALLFFLVSPEAAVVVTVIPENLTAVFCSLFRRRLEEPQSAPPEKPDEEGACSGILGSMFYRV